MKLTRNQREALDMRYTAYNPDEVLEEDNTSFTLICPLHGAYRCESERLKQRYMKRTLRPPSCPFCENGKGTDREFMSYIRDAMEARQTDSYTDPEDYPLHEDYKLMEHWKKPNFQY